MKTLLPTIIVFVFLLSCHKDSGPNVTLDGKLTDCPSGSSCTYNFYNNADFGSGLQAPVVGNQTVFMYKSINGSICDATTYLYFKAPSGVTSFDITDAQIAAGQARAGQAVNYGFSCVCCDVIGGVKPLGGEIKGKKTDGSHWLVNASVIVGNPTVKFADTIMVSQNFTVANLP